MEPTEVWSVNECDHYGGSHIICLLDIFPAVWWLLGFPQVTPLAKEAVFSKSMLMNGANTFKNFELDDADFWMGNFIQTKFIVTSFICAWLRGEQTLYRFLEVDFGYCTKKNVQLVRAFVQDNFNFQYLAIILSYFGPLSSQKVIIFCWVNQ